MQKKEWGIILLLFLAGAICMTLSSVWILPGLHKHLSVLFFTICLMFIIPFGGAAIIYFIYWLWSKKKRE